MIAITGVGGASSACERVEFGLHGAAGIAGSLGPRPSVGVRPGAAENASLTRCRRALPVRRRTRIVLLFSFGRGSGKGFAIFMSAIAVSAISRRNLGERHRF